MTRCVDVPTMSSLVEDIGAPSFIGELADTIEQDFIRWPDFDKSARVANHSEIGVIELMPVSNASRYAFKYVNGQWRRPAPYAAEPTSSVAASGWRSVDVGASKTANAITDHCQDQR